MNIRDLKYLVALAEHKHFGKAARASHVSQPALSIQIKKLENSLGVQLLERNSKSVMLTDIGIKLAEKAQYILNHTHEFQEIAQFAQNPYAGKIKIGLIPSTAPYLLPLILQTLSANFPLLKFYLMEWPTAGLIERVYQHQLDAAVLPFPLQEDKKLITSPLYMEELLLAVPKHHILAKRKAIHQRECENESLLLLEDGHCMSEDLKHFCENISWTEKTNFKATSLETLRHMVEIDVGVALMPKLACRQNDKIVYVPFYPPMPQRQIGMVWRRGIAKDIALRQIAEQIIAIVSKII